jgi:CBS domain-containing protein
LRSVSGKQQREYERIKQSAEKSGRYGNRAEEVAARTVMEHPKERCHKRGQEPREATMLLRKIMTRNVEVIRPDATLEEAAEKMKTRNVRALPVCDRKRVVGMITDRDITVRATAEGCDPKTAKVREAMTPDIIYCFEHQDVHEAARIMEEHQIRRLVVVNGDKQLVGIVSLCDLAT